MGERHLGISLYSRLTTNDGNALHFLQIKEIILNDSSYKNSPFFEEMRIFNLTVNHIINTHVKTTYGAPKTYNSYKLKHLNFICFIKKNL